MRSPKPVQAWLLHAVRIALIATTAWAIHFGHVSRLTQSGSASTKGMPDVSWRGATLVAHDDGTASIVDYDGDIVGSMLQTSPAGDEAIGFSGPSNVLIELDSERIITGVEIIDSGDTVEHVAAVNASSNFSDGWTGLTLDQARTHQIDAVSGATLTSIAANEAIMIRLGGEPVSLLFPDPVTLSQAQVIFPAATDLRPLWRADQTEVLAAENTLGYLLRPTWQGIEFSGNGRSTGIPTYGGPTDVIIGLDLDLNIVGVHYLTSYDNEPYSDYVRDDTYFRKAFLGQSFAAFHEKELFEIGVEGVSGATMTSMTIAETIHESSARFDGITEPPKEARSTGVLYWLSESWLQLAAIAVGSIIALTRGRRRWAVIWPVFVFVWLGWQEGLLLSQAMFVGWARYGWNTAGGYGLIALATAAFFFPVAAGRNVYCSHLCAHGAAQMLVRNRLPRRWRIPASVTKLFRVLPAVLLLVVVAVAASGGGLNLVNLEAFDAYLWPVCGWIPLAIALGGFVASLFEPMAYCRFACPTGSLLDYVRRHRRSDRWTRVDWFALVLASFAWAFAIT